MVLFIEQRTQTYQDLSIALTKLNQNDLRALLETSSSPSVTTGGTSTQIRFQHHDIFVKKIPLTAVEKETKNYLMTANYFQLPLYYHYGIGSAGFGAWRELFCHRLTTAWVLSKQCTHFPLLYHWCILPRQSEDLLDKALLTTRIEQQGAVWGHTKPIHRYLQKKALAQDELVLFLEFIPQTLDDWLQQKIDESTPDLFNHFLTLEKELKRDIGWFNRQGLLHFDLHFKNLLTDGHQLFFTDFGLAMHKDFDFCVSERSFFNQHKDYDQCYALAYLAKSILLYTFERKHGKVQGYKNILLKRITYEESFTNHDHLNGVLNHYLPLVKAMSSFLDELTQNNRKHYPAKRLNNVLNAVV